MIVHIDSSKGHIGASDQEAKGENQRREACHQTQLDDSCAFQLKLLHQVAAQERTAASRRDTRKPCRDKQQHLLSREITILFMKARWLNFPFVLENS